MEDLNSETDLHQCSSLITLNLSNEWAASIMVYSTTENIFFSFGIPILIFVGSFTNLAFIFTVIRVKSMHTITNAYLVNVSIADFLFVFVGAGSYFLNYHASPVRFDTSYYHSWVGCTIAFGVTYIMYSASMVLITLVAVERYCAICRPLQLRLVSGKRRTISLIIVSWIVGIVLTACTVPRYGGNVAYCVIWPQNEYFASFPRIIRFCVAFHSDVFLFSEAMNVIPFVLAMICNLVMYSHIIFALTHRPSNDHSQTSSVDDRIIQIRNQVARLLILNGSLFFICQAPFRIASIHGMVEQITGIGLFTEVQYGQLLLITRCLVIINSCINPVVYFCTSPLYRKAFYKAFISCKSASYLEETKLSTLSTVRSAANER